MSNLPATYDLQAYHGDTWSQSFRFNDGTNYIDLSTSSVTSEAVARSGADFGASYTLDTTVESDPGTVTLRLPLGMPVGDYSYDVQVTTGQGITTWIRGTLTVIPDVSP
jgi:hypothetical protein